LGQSRSEYPFALWRAIVFPAGFSDRLVTVIDTVVAEVVLEGVWVSIEVGNQLVDKGTLFQMKGKPHCDSPADKGIRFSPVCAHETLPTCLVQPQCQWQEIRGLLSGHSIAIIL
jgi:hypothetical protein